jgi:magnesium transporter
MLSIFAPDGMALRKTGPVDPAALPDSAVWIDLENPTLGEDRAVERLAGVTVPTREDMQRSRFPAASMSRTARAT